MNRILATLRRLGWRLRERCRRYRRAWLYARRRLTADDAQIMILYCRDPAGWHPLVVLAVEDALTDALEQFHDHPELARLVADGCARVESKWEDLSDTLSEARRWAIDLAQGCAEQEGIVLRARDAEADDDVTDDGSS